MKPNRHFEDSYPRQSEARTWEINETRFSQEAKMTFKCVDMESLQMELVDLSGVKSVMLPASGYRLHLSVPWSVPSPGQCRPLVSA